MRQIILRDFMPIEEYKTVANRFRPAADWADQIADQAVRTGARYVVLTTRHHDGYCLFNTQTDAFNAVRVPDRGPTMRQTTHLYSLCSAFHG